MRALVAVGIVLGLACGKPEAPTPSTGDPLRCNSDHDCVLACGPCAPGAIVTETAAMAECVVNPCPNATALCSPKHVCVVGP
jgi:hypothetical protein